jgi:cytochrome P450
MPEQTWFLFDLGNTVIKLAYERVMENICKLASANRDERRWSRADELLITRERHRHVSFGEGIHHCLGAPLARMEARIVLEEALPLLTDYHPTGPVERRFTPSERTIVRLPAAVRWR